MNGNICVEGSLTDLTHGIYVSRIVYIQSIRCNFVDVRRVSVYSVVYSNAFLVRHSVRISYVILS